ncbi:MAG TPA: dual specificity protein phosphatase [Devosia sp.]|nr:dual specificity protein phosphatase [Devosia sp.]
MEKQSRRYDRPKISSIYENLQPYGVDIFIGGMEGARDLALLAELGITTVVNCAVNLDLNYVVNPLEAATDHQVAYGPAAIRYYKIGLVDGDGNPETMMLAGYYLLRGALEQVLPERASYPLRERGNVLINCRGGRSRSVVLTGLLLHQIAPQEFPTLDAALDHVRTKRELRPDEWHEAPKPMLVAAARKASDWIEQIERAHQPPAPLRKASNG